MQLIEMSNTYLCVCKKYIFIKNLKKMLFITQSSLNINIKKNQDTNRYISINVRNVIRQKY